MFVQKVELTGVLIPFKNGARVKRELRRMAYHARCLNPLQKRGTRETQKGRRGTLSSVLIPFKNGARVKPRGNQPLRFSCQVLIPFKNGARVKQIFTGCNEINEVLIPFKNGARVKRERCGRVRHSIWS